MSVRGCDWGQRLGHRHTESRLGTYAPIPPPLPSLAVSVRDGDTQEPYWLRVRPATRRAAGSARHAGRPCTTGCARPPTSAKPRRRHRTAPAKPRALVPVPVLVLALGLGLGLGLRPVPCGPAPAPVARHLAIAPASGPQSGTTSRRHSHRRAPPWRKPGARRNQERAVLRRVPCENCTQQEVNTTFQHPKQLRQTRANTAKLGRIGWWRRGRTSD